MQAKNIQIKNDIDLPGRRLVPVPRREVARVSPGKVKKKGLKKLHGKKQPKPIKLSQLVLFATQTVFQTSCKGGILHG